MLVEVIADEGPSTVEHAYYEWIQYVLEQSFTFAECEEELLRRITEVKTATTTVAHDGEVGVFDGHTTSDMHVDGGTPARDAGLFDMVSDGTRTAWAPASSFWQFR